MKTHFTLVEEERSTDERGANQGIRNRWVESPGIPANFGPFRTLSILSTVSSDFDRALSDTFN